MCFLCRKRHDHTLARGQAVGLDDDGRAQSVDVGMGQRRVAERFVGRRGNAMACHEGLGEGLGAFKLRRGLGRAEHLEPVGTEFVDHAGRQRRFGTDHGQADLFGLRPFAQRHDIGQGQVFELAARQCRATVARCNKHLGRLGRLRQFPRQSVLTASAANHKNFHKSALW